VIHQRQKFIARLFARAERAQRVDSLLNHLRHLLRQAFLNLQPPGECLHRENTLSLEIAIGILSAHDD
jgi:hypothetical protein